MTWQEDAELVEKVLIPGANGYPGRYSFRQALDAHRRLTADLARGRGMSYDIQRARRLAGSSSDFGKIARALEDACDEIAALRVMLTKSDHSEQVA